VSELITNFCTRGHNGMAGVEKHCVKPCASTDLVAQLHKSYVGGPAAGFTIINKIFAIEEQTRSFVGITLLSISRAFDV